MSTRDVVALTECVVPLDAEGRRAVRRYWERVIREEWVPPVERAAGRGSLVDLDERRTRRRTRRAMARIAATSRTAPVRALDTAQEGPGFGGEAA